MQKPFPRALSAAALALLFGTTSVYANEPKSETSGASQGAQATQPISGGSTSGASASRAQETVGEVSEGDRQIMHDIAEANLAEISTSQIALERSQDPGIRQFAQRMIDDHKTLHERVADLARVKDVQLPQQPAEKHQQLAQRLSTLEGEEFNRVYRQQVGEQAHEQTHQLLQRAITEADDPQLVAMATQALPLIDQHLTMAENLSGEGGTSGASGDPATGSMGASGGPTQERDAAEGMTSGGMSEGAAGASGDSTSGTTGTTGTTPGTTTGGTNGGGSVTSGGQVSDTLGGTASSSGGTGAGEPSPAESGASAPQGASGASMSTRSGGGASSPGADQAGSGAESVSGVSSGSSSTMTGPGKN